MTEIKIGCIVVLYNPDKAVVDNISHYPPNISQIVLVDNSSVDNSGLFNQISQQDVTYIPLYNNTGIAHAINVGINSIKGNADYIITMDQDSRLTSTVIDVYVETIKENKKHLVLTPNYDTDRRQHKKEFGYENIVLSMQSGMLFKTEIFDKVGLFNEDLFIDVVDYEYCLRLRKKRIEIVRCNKAVLKHKPADTREKQILFYKLKYGCASPLRYYYQARNLHWTIRKYKSLKLLTILLVKFIKIILFFDNKNEYLSMFFKGIKDAKKSRMGKFEEG